MWCKYVQRVWKWKDEYGGKITTYRKLAEDAMDKITPFFAGTPGHWTAGVALPGGDFPVGDVDPRLPVHEDVIGVVTSAGTPVAFQRSRAIVALKQGTEITFENVRLQLEAGGIKAVDADGTDLGSHQAFWFAWSQFHPKTALWPE